MNLRKFIRASVSGTFSAAAFLAAAMGLSSAASAQSIFFDWGSNETVNDSGRDIVTFDTKARQGELIVSFGDRRVYYIIGPGKALSYPIAVPREKSKWEGVTNVSQKRVNPSWTPTPEMIRENPRLPPWVPGGHPMNPLGTHALYLGSSSYRIHGTDAPWTIGTAASKGCVRMYNKDVQDLYPRVPVGTKVTVTYKTYTTSPLDSSSAKGILAELDKGRKLKPSDNVAEAAAQASKKWRDGDDAEVAKVSQQPSGDKEKDDGTANGSPETATAENTVNDDSETPRPTVITANKSLTAWSYPGKKASADDEATDATVQEPLPSDGTASDKKRTSDKKGVETGSVEPSGDGTKTSKSGSTERKATERTDENNNAQERAERKEKSEPAQRKAEKTDDAAAIATRALAAAERAAAAAERAAEAAERASLAAVKATAKTEAPREPEKAAEAAPLSEWPVVKSGTP